MGIDISTAPGVLSFADNQLLPALFGSRDGHLAQIEKALGVSLVNRGNLVAINGPGDASARARLVLNSLYSRLEAGEPVDAADVTAALNMVARADGSSAIPPDVVIRTPRGRLSPRSPLQAAYIQAMRSRELVFALGPAGTGKTWLAVFQAVALLLAGDVDRIILSRPAVEAGERIGFLPGDMREKVDPYLRPIYDALHEALPADRIARLLENGVVEIAPLAFMRGRTLRNAFILLDEAQNTTQAQMKMFLTRIGPNSRMVVTGDPTQLDLPPGKLSGLEDAAQLLRGLDRVSVIRFGESDVTRHRLVAQIVAAYAGTPGAGS